MAERLGRRWVGIEMNLEAYDVVRMRLERVADEEGFFRDGDLLDVIVWQESPLLHYSVEIS